MLQARAACCVGQVWDKCGNECCKGASLSSLQMLAGHGNEHTGNWPKTFEARAQQV